ncbi:DUF4342 domain-containing protein [Modestobacter versicolor]|uniref:DUF4342 domain-containing protein n=1 Tax=Modestobacter versicolor TaxID=429133 RepID=A0A323VAI8_9ACTN|nr:DUF4342 domain-containing protein [Modestobacter versicolor]MBB3674728.1 hypothetical protein [Modestobacter versicolor]PZA21705.1 hypothetical protein DMO24_08870 [Modestobacter versicolor]
MPAANSRYQEIQVAGDELVTRVRELVHEGNVSRLSIKKEDGETVLEVPLTAGVAVAAAGALVWPALVALGAVAALFTHVTIGVERRGADEAPA